jgi:hypothetical protein
VELIAPGILLSWVNRFKSITPSSSISSNALTK